ncbi:hypothetical protein PI125_g20653 [Phytophthora idaei]|nr:hypothetical protein PI125_g20653 [Phytophthora idaei]
MLLLPQAMRHAARRHPLLGRGGLTQVGHAPCPIGDKLNIWLGSRTSKTQWQSGFLSKEEYVTAANTFVDASSSGYAWYFQQCLDRPPDKTLESYRKLCSLIFSISDHHDQISSAAVSQRDACLDCSVGKDGDAECKLTQRKDRKLRLELSLKIRLLLSTRSTSYALELQPTTVGRIDTLESKQKDDQEGLQKLRSAVGANNRVFLYAESGVLMETKLQWMEVSMEVFVLSDDKTSIVVLVPGLYVFGALVNLDSVADDCAGPDE